MVSKHRLWEHCRLATQAILMAAALLALPLTTHAQDFSKEFFWYEDTTQQLGLEAVRDKPFVPFEKTLTKRSGDGILWIRIHIDPQVPADKDTAEKRDNLILLVNPNSIDKIELFDPLYSGESPRRAGVFYPWSTAEYPALSRAFSLPVAQEARDVWLKIQSKGTRRVEVELLKLVEARKSEFRQQAIFSAYLALNILFLGYGTIQFSLSPDRLIGAFITRHILSILVSFTATGYTRILLADLVPVQWLGSFGTFLMLTFIISAVRFEYIFVSEMRPPPWVKSVMKWLLISASIPIAMLLMGQWHAAMQLLMLAAVLIPILGIFIASNLGATPLNDRGIVRLLPKHWLVGSYVGRAAFNIVPVFSFLGWLELSVSPLQTFMGQQTFVGLIMMILLYFRTRQQFFLRDQTAMQLAVERERVIAERASRDEQKKLMDMLTHELKTPLAAMTMLVNLREVQPDLNAKLRSMVTNVHNIIDRCLDSARSEPPALTPRMQEVDVSLKIRDILLLLSDAHRIGIKSPNHLMWRTDPHILQMIISNLLDNATKYSQQTSPIQLGLEIVDFPQRTLQIWIENEEGPAGFPDPKLLFSKYYRNPLASSFAGSGLGLYLIHGAITALGGSIRCQVSNNRIRFELCLPS